MENIPKMLEMLSSTSTGVSTSTASKNHQTSITGVSCTDHDFDPTTKAELNERATEARRLLEMLKVQNNALVSPNVTSWQAELIRDVERKAVSGMILDFGVGTSSPILLAAWKHPERCLHIFSDAVENSSSSVDDNGVVESRANDEGKDLPKNTLESFVAMGYEPDTYSVFFHEGPFNDTVSPKGPVAYANVIGDNYKTTYAMLDRISPSLSQGAYATLDRATSLGEKAFQNYYGADVHILQRLTNCKCNMLPLPDS